MNFTRVIRVERPIRMGGDVAQVQRRLGVVPHGIYDEETAALVRAFQIERGLLTTGEVDEPTWLALEGLITAGLVPAWFTEGRLDEAERRLGEPVTEASLRRYQSARGLPLTGLLDEQTAVALGG